MRKLIVTNIISLDGCFEGPDRNVMVMPMDGAFDAYNLERMENADTVLLGETSCQLFTSFWPGMATNPDASPTHRKFAELYNAIQKVVVSSKLKIEDLAEQWRKNTRFIEGDGIYEDIKKLKAEDGKDIVMYASRKLWNDLLAHGLVDELHFVVGNVVLGPEGTRLFDETISFDDPKHGLQVKEVRSFEGSQNHLVVYGVAYK
jgi:dihydrofolate reductase